MKDGKRPSDHQVEGFIGGLLRVGVIVSACIVAVGGVLFLSRHAWDTPHYRPFQGEPAFLEHLGNVVTAAFSLRSEAVVQLGILVLIAVPVFRVAVSIVAFLLKRDWLYTVVTSVVLIVLLFALLGGKV
ncbi:MAG TPA: DUF1634 domain-containing protein [Spirochaetia bacterium]|nr:DUF1634 domain-containing protein [Spirochaetia bacterium]